jgi:hypothetical protein
MNLSDRVRQQVARLHHCWWPLSHPSQPLPSAPRYWWRDSDDPVIRDVMIERRSSAVSAEACQAAYHWVYAYYLRLAARQRVDRDTADDVIARLLTDYYLHPEWHPVIWGRQLAGRLHSGRVGATREVHLEPPIAEMLEQSISVPDDDVAADEADYGVARFGAQPENLVVRADSKRARQRHRETRQRDNKPLWDHLNQTAFRQLSATRGGAGQSDQEWIKLFGPWDRASQWGGEPAIRRLDNTEHAAKKHARNRYIANLTEAAGYSSASDLVRAIVHDERNSWNEETGEDLIDLIRRALRHSRDTWTEILAQPTFPPLFCRNVIAAACEMSLYILPPSPADLPAEIESARSQS